MVEPRFTWTDSERATLQALCDTLIPSLAVDDDPHGFWARPGMALPLVDGLAEMLAVQSAAQQREMHRLLRLLDSPLLAWPTLGRRARAFRTLSPPERERLLQGLANSRSATLRRAFQALKRAICYLFYALIDEDGSNPNWPALGYPGPLSAPPQAVDKLPLLLFDRAQQLRCDTLIVGSGAGGGVVAGELAEAGDEVIVVEKGPYLAEDQFTQRELEMTASLYEVSGTLASDDLSVVVLAGSCLGGGTTINWSAAFRPPEHLLREWATDHLLPHLLTPEFADSVEAVARALNVNRDESSRNPQNEALWRALQQRDANHAVIPRNVRGCNSIECGYCGLGCQRGTKQSMLKSYLPRAVAAGARLLAETEVMRILIEAGQVVGATALQRGADGRRVPITIRAKRVVVAAGAIHTPALLRRSGLRHPQIGQNLKLHPTVAVAGRYDQPMEPWRGVMMATVSEEWAYLDGGYGVRIETPPAHPGLMALALPWQSGAQHKALMADAAQTGVFIVLTRDRDGGEVRLDRRGQPLIRYRLSRYDRAHLLRGIHEAVALHQSAGASRVTLPHQRQTLLTPSHGKAFTAPLAEMAWWGWGPNQFALFSAHQMGSCGMGGDGQRHPLKANGESREVRGLFVADGSVFPAASGVNPMLTIQAMAHYTAQGMKG